MFACFRQFDYPRDRMEWIIVDDGTDSVQDLVEEAQKTIPQIKYFKTKKMVLGKKRNYMHEKCQGDIIIYMDDDDYYPPERISHAVDMLTKHPQALCAGSSEIYVYFKTEAQMIRFGPYSPNHATAGTFAFQRKLLTQTKYNDDKALAEEREFLKDYTIPFVQLDPLKTILVFSHDHNTFNKRKLLQNMENNPTINKSEKRVEDFIRQSTEREIQRFFMDEVDQALQNYDWGNPRHKPEVLEQIEQLEAERQKLMKQHQQQPILYLQQQPGAPSVPLSAQQVVEIIQQQANLIQTMKQQCLCVEENGQSKMLTPPQIMEIMQQQIRIIEEQTSVIQQLQQQKIVIQQENNQPLLALDHTQIIEYIQQLHHQIHELTAKV
jgi:glycosyltransferase involved in cell wall biosynthesis